LSASSLYSIDLKQITIENKYLEPSFISIDQESQIDKINLAEKISNSVMVNQSSLPTHSSIISIRGNNFKATDYYEDGLPLYKTIHGYTDISMYRANDTQISINPGGGQGVYAPSATGGEILLNSKKVKSGFNAEVFGTLSTNDTYLNIAASQKSNNWYVKFDFNTYNSDSYKLSNSFETTEIQQDKNRVNADKKQFDGSLKLGVDISANSKLSFKVSHLESDFGVPIQVYDEPSNPFNENANYTRVEDKALTDYWLFYDYKGSDVEVSFRAYYDKYQDTFDFYTSPEFETLLFPSSTYNDSRVGSIVSLKYKNTQTQSSKLSFRVDRDRHEQDINADNKSENYEMMNYSLAYMYENRMIKSLLLRASAEYKNQDSKKAYQFSENESNYDDNSALSAQLNGYYKLDERQNYYMTIAHKNRFASLGEIYQVFPWDQPNTEINPEYSDSMEVGANWKLLYDSIIDMSVYYNSVKDMILYEDNAYRNIDEATIKGFEFHLYNYSFESNEIEFSYAYCDARDNRGEKIVQTPSSKLFLQDNIEINSQLSYIASYLYSSSRDDIYNSQRYTLDGYGLADMELSYTPITAFNVKVGVKNLLDENWEYAHGFASMGRSFFASLKYEY